MQEKIRKKTISVCKEVHKMARSMDHGQNKGLHMLLPPKRLRMYELYFRMEKYDGDMIDAAFPDDKPTNLSTTKRQLLEQMIDYCANDAPNDGMRDLAHLIIEAKYLKFEGQVNLAMERINLAVRAALSLQAMAELLDIIEVRRGLVETLVTVEPDELDYQALEVEGLQHIMAHHLLAAVFSKANRLRQRPAQERLAGVDALEAELEHLPFPALARQQVRYRKIRFSIARIRLDFQASMAEAQGILDALEAHPGLLKDRDLREEYFNKMGFMIAGHADCREFKIAEQLLNKLKAAALRWAGGVQKNPGIYARYMYSSLIIQLNLRNWDVAAILSKQVFKDVVQDDLLKNVDMRAGLLRLSTLTTFINRDFKLTRLFVHVLRKELTEYRPQVAVIMPGITYLLSFVEQCDPYLKVALKDVSAWYAQLGFTGRYETILLGFFQKVSEDDSSSATTSSLTELRLNLSSLFQDQAYHKFRDEIFPIMEWIAAKLEGLDFRSKVFLGEG